MHYVITFASVAVIGTYLLASRRTRPKIFVHKGSVFTAIFSLYALVVSLIALNWIGAACAVGFFLVMVIILYARSSVTKAVFESSLNLSCFLSLFVTLFAVIERLLHHSDQLYRCKTVFFNPNYMATVVSTVVIICAYKVITRQGNPVLYYTIAAFNVVSLYLCGSLFAWVNIFIAVAALLFMFHRHQLLSIFLLVAATGCLVIYSKPDLLPRLAESQLTTENRFDIWTVAIKAIVKSPLFGRGFLTYYNIYQNYPGSYPTQHTHSIYLDPLLNFGIIGTALLLVYFVYYYQQLIRCRNLLNNSRISDLIFALTASTMVHGLVDVTILWIQTGLLLGYIMAGLGVEERMLIARHK